MDFPDGGAFDTGLRITFADQQAAISLVRWLSRHEITDSKILASNSVIDRIRASFPVNSEYQSLIERNGLDTKSRSGDDLPSMIITDERAYLALKFLGETYSVKINNEDVHSELTATFDSVFETSDNAEMAVPAWDRLLTQLEETVGTETKEEYRRLIAAASNDVQSLDEVSVALVAAALSGALNYDIAKWGEEMNIASKATFSRRKKQLEEKEVIQTEKVPVDVGRPRQRLRLNDRVGPVNLDIGVNEEEIGIEAGETDEQVSVDDNQSDKSSETDNLTGEQPATQSESESPAEFIAQLNEELREVITDDETG